MTIGDLGTALRRFWRLALGLFAAILALGVASIALRADSFRSDAVLAIAPVRGGLAFETNQAVQLIIPPTIARIEAPAFASLVRSRVEPRFRDERFAISAENDPGTAVLSLSVESSTAAAALAGARAASIHLSRRSPSRNFAIEVLSPPAAATSVRAQRAPPIIAGSLVLGLIVGVLAAATAHRLRPQLPRGERFRERFGHEVLGEIPSYRARRSGPTAEVLASDGSARAVEAFSDLQTRLARRLAGRGQPDLNVAIAVTSWGELEGKSLIVANLACALSAYGHDVTVIDCDMRRPGIHTLLGARLEPGVADVADGASVASVRQGTALEALEVIAAGTAARHPARLAKDASPRLLSALSQRLVLIDTPPMFTPETTAIVAAADYVLLVADYAARRPEQLREALADLELGGTEILGVVLNRVDVPDVRGRDRYLFRAPPATAAEPAARPAEETAREPSPARARAARPSKSPP